MSDLRLFAGLPQALARICLTDGRTRREIAEEAGINPSMLSGYCSGRLTPSLVHLDRLLVALNCRLDRLVAELQAVDEAQLVRRATQNAVAKVDMILDDMKRILLEHVRPLREAPEAAPPAEPAQPPAAAYPARPEWAQKAVEDMARADARLMAEGVRKGRKRPKRKEP